MAVDRPRLGFIAGFGPAAGALLEVAGLFTEPIELVGVALHDHQRMAHIDRVIGTETELAAGLQLVGDHPDRPVVHHPALGVFVLGPGIGMEQIDHGERTIGDPRQHFERIAMMEQWAARVGMTIDDSLYEGAAPLRDFEVFFWKPR